MNPLLITPILEIGRTVIDKLFPDPQQKAQAELELLRMQQSGELEAVKVQLSAIIAEASSQDPWTSRARPSFLYVMYVMILASIPLGLFHLLAPAQAQNFTLGVQMWLAAIPEELWWLFGAGYLGYTGARSFDKWRGPVR